MVLNNMKNYLKLASLMGASSTGGDKTRIKLEAGEIILPDGSSVAEVYIGGQSSTDRFFDVLSHFTNSSLSTNETSVLSTRAVSKICFGNGSTPVSAEDYCLENLITSGLSLSSSDISFSLETTIGEDRKTMTRKCVLTIAPKNTLAEAITLNEIGFYQSIPVYSTAKNALMHREVFATPVIIESGAKATFTFTFTFVNSIE